MPSPAVSGRSGPTPRATPSCALSSSSSSLTYRRYGPILRAWMEGHVDDRHVSAMGVKAFTDIATALGKRMHAAGAPGDVASISALMALLERVAYFLVSRRLEFENGAVLDTLTPMIHRGFFTAAPTASAGGARSSRNAR